MRAPNVGEVMNDHTIRRILVDQGPNAARTVLESFGPRGDQLRKHVKSCQHCANVKRELYGDKEIPVANDPLSPELLELLQDKGE